VLTDGLAAVLSGFSGAALAVFSGSFGPLLLCQAQQGSGKEEEKKK
jgi:hypothetical protein